MKKQINYNLYLIQSNVDIVRAVRCQVIPACSRTALAFVGTPIGRLSIEFFKTNKKNIPEA